MATYEELVEFGKKHVDELVEILNLAFEKFLPKNQRPQVVVENLGEEDLSIRLVGSSFTIDLVEKEIVSIVKRADRPAWQLTYWKHHWATRWEPEDYEDVPIESYFGHWQAASAAVVAVFRENVEGWFEAEGEARMMKEMEDLTPP